MTNSGPVELLVVEDNPNDLELVLAAFEENKLANTIHVTRDGAEALEYLFGTGAYDGRNVLNVPRLILLDLKLPKVSGIEVLQRIRRDPRTRHANVVVMTSSREERDVTEAYMLGVNSYVTKPVNFKEFTDVVVKLGYYWLLINQTPSLPPFVSVQCEAAVAGAAK